MDLWTTRQCEERVQWGGGLEEKEEGWMEKEGEDSDWAMKRAGEESLRREREDWAAEVTLGV